MNGNGMMDGKILRISRIIPFIVLLSFVLLSLIPSYVSALPLIRDAEIEHTLHTYSAPILRAAGLKPSAVKIFIVQDDSLNAFVAGGANLFLHTGLIMATGTPDMMIGVIAHETGHIAGGHLAQGTEKLKDAQLGTIFSYVLGAAAAAGGSPEAAAAIISGGQSTVARNVMAFTRAHEESADQAALGYLDKVGISASGMLRVFNLLQRQEREHFGQADPYLRTHPLSASRIEHIRNAVDMSKIPEGQHPESYTILHKRMVAKLYGFLKSPEQTLQKYPMSDISVPARMARAVAYYKMPDVERSIKEMDALLAESPKDAFFHELKGQILFENGRSPEALASYTTAAKLLPSSALILTDLAKVEMSEKSGGTLQSAIVHLEKAATIDNSNSTTWRLLATAYGRQGNMGMSSLALAEEAILRANHKSALDNAERAIKALRQGTPAQQRAQDIKALALSMKQEEEDAKSPF